MNDFYHNFIHTTSHRRFARDCFYLLAGALLVLVGLSLGGCVENAPPADRESRGGPTLTTSIALPPMPAPTPAKDAGSIQHTQALIDRLPVSGSGVIGDKAIGGVVELPAGELVWDRPLKWPQGVTIIGKRAGTRIRYTGPAGTYCFTIVAAANSIAKGGNGSVDSPELIGVQVHCLNGGDAIGIDRSSVLTVKNPTIQDVVVRGGSIDLTDIPAIDPAAPRTTTGRTGEHYWATLDNVRMYDPPTNRPALRLHGQAHTLRHFHVFGARPAGSPDLIEINGSCTFEGFPWVEGWFAGTTLRLNPWVSKGGYVHRGNYDAGNFWIEDHTENDGATVVVDTADFHVLNYGGTVAWPIQLKNAAGLFLQRAINAGSVKIDGTPCKVFIGGTDTAIEPVK